MSAATETPAPDTEPKRVKPNQLALVLFTAAGLFTLVSGIIPQITGWKSDSPIHRTVFVNIPGAIQVAFYTVIPVLLIWVGIMFSFRMKNWERGAPVAAPHHHQERQAAPQGLPRRCLHADTPA